MILACYLLFRNTDSICVDIHGTPFLIQCSWCNGEMQCKQWRSVTRRGRAKTHAPLPHRFDKYTIQEAVLSICMYALTNWSCAAADRSVRPATLSWVRSWRSLSIGPAIYCRRRLRLVVVKIWSLSMITHADRFDRFHLCKYDWETREILND